MKEYVKPGDVIRMENRRMERGGYSEMETVVARIDEVHAREMAVSVYKDDNPEAYESYKGYAILSQVEKILCNECYNEKIYHDADDDYVCPWCEL